MTGHVRVHPGVPGTALGQQSRALSCITPPSCTTNPPRPHASLHPLPRHSPRCDPGWAQELHFHIPVPVGAGRLQTWLENTTSHPTLVYPSPDQH